MAVERRFDRSAHLAEEDLRHDGAVLLRLGQLPIVGAQTGQILLNLGRSLVRCAGNIMLLMFVRPGWLR
jgi:hypothetical protein